MLKARAKGSSGWKDYKSCSIGISLRSPNHTGEALEAIVEWMNGKFDYCTIDLTDSLERHNIMLETGMTEAEAHKRANQMGDEWLQANGPILSKLQMPMSMLRWDHWHSESNKPKLLRLQAEFTKAAFNDPNFNDALEADINRFYERRFGLKPNQVSQEQREMSRKYLIEEMAGHTLLYKDYRSATIYPGVQQESFKMLRDGLVNDVSKGLTKSYYTRLTIYDPNKVPNESDSESDGMPANQNTRGGNQKTGTSRSVTEVASPLMERLLLPFRDRDALAISPI